MAHIVDLYQTTGLNEEEAQDRKNAWRTRIDNNLVISNRKGRRPNTNEPTGEAESLYGKITKEMMGDKAMRTDPRDLIAKMKEAHPQAEEKVEYAPKRRRKVYDADDVGGYVPTTKETKEEHAKILSLVQIIFSDKPYAFIRSATQDVIDILKTEGTPTEKYDKLKKEIDSSISEEAFTEMLQSSNLLTDYVKEDNEENEEENKEDVVPIIGDEESEEDVVYEEQESEENEIKMEVENLEGDGIEIDAEYLLNTMKSIFKDEEEAKDRCFKVEKILGNTSLNDGQAQQLIVGVLGEENYTTVSVIVRNREEIVGRIAMSRAPTDEIRDAIRLKLPSTLKHSSAENYDENKRKMNEENDAGQYTRKLKIVDFESLSFGDGSHFMSKQQATFPENTVRTDTAEYTRVDIPMTLPTGPTVDLVPISKFPEWAKSAMNPLKYLNRMQSKVYNSVFLTDDNVLVCAPTGAGKTTVALMAILECYKQAVENNEKFKVIYIAPMKSLVQEMVGTFRGKLEKLGLQVGEMSGDSTLSKGELSTTQVIVATPEKIDVISRKTGGVGSANGHGIFEELKLVIIDEIHLLHDTRGPVIEALVARVKKYIEYQSRNIRLVGLSATLPNCQDVGLFLGCKKENIFVFGGEYRPVPLQQTFFGVTEKKPIKRNRTMNSIMFDIIKESAGKQQVLVFVHSRKDTLQTAKFIKERAIEENILHYFLLNKKASEEVLRSESSKFDNTELQELVRVGVGIHHAGMNKDDRRLVEDLYADNHLQVLVSTATLAWGVNLPAHTVIIKGTQVYSPEAGHWEELSPMDIMQMMGRAGRPQFDKEGSGYVITTQREMFFYMSLLSQQLPIESQFVNKLIDCLNAEIVTGNVKTMDEGVQWLSLTYYYICCLRSPKMYSVDDKDIENDPTLEWRRKDLIHSAATILHKNGLILYDQKNRSFAPTELGKIASYYYLTNETMRNISDNLKRNTNEIDLVSIFAKSSEFKYVSVRETEKPEIEKLLQQVPIPLKGNAEDPETKIGILLQTYIGRLQLPGYVLSADTIYVSQNASRIFRSIFEILLLKRWAQPALKALEISISVNRRLFGSQCPLRQLHGVPSDLCKRLERVEFPFSQMSDLTAEQLGELIRQPNKGNMLYNLLHSFPNVKVSACGKPISRGILKVDVKVELLFEYDKRVLGHSQGYWLCVVDMDGSNILSYQYFVLKENHKTKSLDFELYVPIIEPVPFSYFVYVVSDSFVKCTSTCVVRMDTLILPTKFITPTKVLPLKALDTQFVIHELGLDGKVKLPFKLLNEIQTQVFQSVVESNNSVYVGAHSGAGKTLIAELAIMKQLKTDEKRAVIYISPFEEDAQKAFEALQAAFGNYVRDIESGIDKIEEQIISGGVIFITVSDFEKIIKTCKRKHNVLENIALIVLDDIQHIGEDVEYEVLISRIKHIQKENNQLQMRLVCLSLPLGDSKSLRDWLGVSTGNAFSFSPQSRVAPLDVRVEVMRQSEFFMRISAMVQPTLEIVFDALKCNKTVTVCVPNHKNVIRVAREYVALSRKQQIKNDERIVEVLKRYPLEDNTLREGIESGVCMVYSEMSEHDEIIVKNVFKEGIVRVLLVTIDQLNSFRERSDIGVVMGTLKSEKSGSDIDIELLVKYIGLIKESVTLYCEPNKRESLIKFIEEPLPLESRLIEQENDTFDVLVRVFNTEIVSGDIFDYQSAIAFFANTFLLKRMRNNPSYYNVNGREMSVVSGFLSSLVESVINKLVEMGFVLFDGEKLTPTEQGTFAVNNVNEMECD
ncbi:U5 small nuclear ribonucleoprotein 200 kDa helicase, putative [Entamoeba invadens IP1]|uniref:U5 small nuclear ribonucleoprotein 200 kDa helicase, putative n=1 Tax=Entamoeba invadens IP1 TaxID=370355 RepID=A0A0A1UCC8_ENTIV|nr:U5 small nuclear ribonucleoprotein 200 kDa helicase, putative [Entamoeba invadens IP1]ELP91343.1 U5 small nuclear ribonucleoprotein 200 kDa helicase, putative [Entamoeba invadens IP1]|eukprot:XP_004258114.1 U5 small nuclear ribonucleoprotein 200 kDa helicase, putative [Entamoeba invadens IP1]